MGDDRDTLRRDRPEPAGVIEVVMRGDHVPDRLVRDEVFDLGQHGCRALVVQWALDEDHVILHLDQHTVMGAAGDVPDAVGCHLSRDLAVWRRRLFDRIGHRSVHGEVGLDVSNGEVERRIRADHLPDPRRELHARKVLVLRIADLDRYVAEHGVRGHRVDLLDQVLGVDGRLHLEAAGGGERDRATLDGAIIGHRGFHDPMGRGPELELPVDQRDGCRSDYVAGRVPGKVAARDEDLALLTHNGLSAAAARRIFALSPHELVPDRRVLVVHDARVALDDEPGPRCVGAEVLADLEVHAAARVLDRLHANRAHRLRDLVEGRVLGGGGERPEQHDDGSEPAQERAHAGLLGDGIVATGMVAGC